MKTRTMVAIFDVVHTSGVKVDTPRLILERTHNPRDTEEGTLIKLGRDAKSRLKHHMGFRPRLVRFHWK